MTTPIQGQPHDRSALILYGSETGNSQEAAEQLERITGRLRFVTQVFEMNHVELNDLLRYTIVIFTISTTGQGDFPANSRIFWKSLLKKRLPANCLSHVNFTTFGFGDSSYVKFNWSARKLHKRLQQLGAQEVYPRGEADDQHPEGTDGSFLPWSLDLISKLLETYPLPDGTLPVPDTELLPPKWTLELAKTVNGTSKSNGDSKLNSVSITGDHIAMDTPITGDLCVKEPPSGPDEVEPFDHNLPPEDLLLSIPDSYTVTVQENSSLTTPDHWQDVRHLNLLVHDKVKYQAGDCVSIFPKNFPEDVDSLIELMDWTEDADKPLRFVPGAGSYLDPTFMPMLCRLHTTGTPTLRSLLLHNLDITAIPKRFFFEVLAKYTSNPIHRDRLLEFCNPVFTDEFFDYTSRPRRSMLEVLQDFPSVRLPWHWAAYIFPVIRPRQFSISSGGRLRNDPPRDLTQDPPTTTVHICVALVKYRTVLTKVRHGLCSRYLASLLPGTLIRVTFQRGSFRIKPTQFHKPILMIAPGTGVAPMRSLIWERAAWREAKMDDSIMEDVKDEKTLASEIQSQFMLQPQPPPQPRLLPQPQSQQPQPRPEAVLIFGGRNCKKDFLYGHEWQNRELDVKVLMAWSRDQREKIYVQDVVRQEAAMVRRMLVEEGGSVFVCGSSGKMPVAVRAAIVDALVAAGKKGDWEFSVEKAEEELKGIEREGRYVQETW